MQEDDETLTTEEAAKIIGITPDTLRMWRVQNKGPDFYKLGDTKQSQVRYLRREVQAYIEKNTNRNN